MLIDGAVGVALAGDAGGAGAGSGEGGAGEGGGEGGSEGLEGTEGQGQEGQGEGTEGGEQEFEIDEATGEPKLDAEGNKVPKQQTSGKVDFKSVHAKLKEVDPAAAEVYRKTHFGYQQYQASFPTPKDAQAAKEVIETYGGPEGIEQLSGEAQAFAAEMDSFSKGDPAFIKNLAEADPEGFAATAPAYIKQLGASNPEAYTAALTPILNATFQQTGMVESVNEAGAILSEVYNTLKAAGNTVGMAELAQAYKALQKTWGVFDYYKKLGDQYGERPLSAKEKQLQQKEQQLSQKERDSFVTSANTDIVKSMDASIDKVLQPFYKQVPKMTRDQKSELHLGVFDLINRQLDSNDKFVKQVRALVAEGDVTRLNSFRMQHINKLVYDAAKKVWNRRAFGVLPNQAKPGNQGNQNVQVNLTRRPKRDDIDWNTTTEEQYMLGEATLKGTKRKVKWDWAKQES